MLCRGRRRFSSRILINRVEDRTRLNTLYILSQTGNVLWCLCIFSQAKQLILSDKSWFFVYVFWRKSLSPWSACFHWGSGWTAFKGQEKGFCLHYQYLYWHLLDEYLLTESSVCLCVCWGRGGDLHGWLSHFTLHLTESHHLQRFSRFWAAGVSDNTIVYGGTLNQQMTKQTLLSQASVFALQIRYANKGDRVSQDWSMCNSLSADSSLVLCILPLNTKSSWMLLFFHSAAKSHQSGDRWWTGGTSPLPVFYTNTVTSSASGSVDLKLQRSSFSLCDFKQFFL